MGERAERWGRSLVVIARPSYGQPRRGRAKQALRSRSGLRPVCRIGAEHAQHRGVRTDLSERLVDLLSVGRRLEVDVEDVFERSSSARARLQLRQVDAAIGERL